MVLHFDVVIGFIDRVRKRYTFAHFVGMLVGSCFKVSYRRFGVKIYFR